MLEDLARDDDVERLVAERQPDDVAADAVTPWALAWASALALRSTPTWV